MPSVDRRTIAIGVMTGVMKEKPTEPKTTRLFGFKKESNKETNLKQNHPVRRLLIFQLKLAVDAIRDILLSPISITASIIDLIQGRKGKNSYFEMLMKFGRNSEKRINLFEQHQGEKQTIDNMLKQVEEVVKREYKKGDITTKTKNAIEAKLKLSRVEQQKNSPE